MGYKGKKLHQTIKAEHIVSAVLPANGHLKATQNSLMYWKNRTGMSKNIILANIGIIIAAVPFVSLKPYQLVFWTVGGILILVSAVLFLRNKLKL